MQSSDVARHRLVGHGVPAVTARAIGACESLGAAVVGSNVFEGSLVALAVAGASRLRSQKRECRGFQGERK